MEYSNKKQWLYFFGGLSLGLGVGFLLGLFEAPDSGERTRKKFFLRAERLKDSFSDQLKQFNSKN